MRLNQNGFTYLALLFAVAIVGVALAATGVLWSTERQRERERELLFVGGQIRQAIGSYYMRSPGLVKRYPAKLDDLIKDDRFITTQRHMRRRYVDPLTNSNEWGLVTAPEGGVMGVYSLADGTPIKHAGFDEQDAEFEGKSHYSDWKFVFRKPLSPQDNALTIHR
jgi:type II secretory pathway pseudopilin PulG